MQDQIEKIIETVPTQLDVINLLLSAKADLMIAESYIRQRDPNRKQFTEGGEQ